MLKETRLSKDWNKFQIDSIYIESGESWLKSLSHKPNVLKELKEKIQAEKSSGVDLRLIFQRYIWH